MSVLRVIDTGLRSPRWNIAMTAALAKLRDADEISDTLRFQRFQPCVLVGRNQDIRRDLEALAAKVQFAWIRKAVVQLDELVEFMRRNIQKSIALDALILSLRSA